MKLLLCISLLLGTLRLQAQEAERAIHAEALVNAGLDAVWEAWTTEAGIKTFFSPACKIELRPNGAYEMYFNPNGAPGERGGEGNEILALQPKTLLAFTWNAPPSLPNVRQQRTSVVVRLKDAGNGQTNVTLVHSGWGEGEEWDKALGYFSSAWSKIVLPRLQQRFVTGPIDWNNPPVANR